MIKKLSLSFYHFVNVAYRDIVFLNSQVIHVTHANLSSLCMCFSNENMTLSTYIVCMYYNLNINPLLKVVKYHL